MRTASDRELWVLFGLTVLGLLLTAYKAFDGLTWFLEVFPVLVAIPLLGLTRRGFPLTRLLYWLIFAHAWILMVGGHYTYARVPLGFWMQDWFHWSRNHYDRIGHLMQGFGPAMIVREVLLRRSPLVRGKWLFFLVLCVCVFVSVIYEFIEWWTAVIANQASVDFLGTQGDSWDTQWDMFFALCGATASLLLLSRTHDRQLGSVVIGKHA